MELKTWEKFLSTTFAEFLQCLEYFYTYNFLHNLQIYTKYFDQKYKLKYALLFALKAEVCLFGVEIIIVCMEGN